MKAHAGDRLVIEGHRVHEPDHEARILEVRGPDGEPPYRIRWSDSGQETLLYLLDARIEHTEHQPAAWAIEVLGRPSCSEAGAPTLTVDEVLGWCGATSNWRRCGRATTTPTSGRCGRKRSAEPHGGARNPEILDRVLERIRQGE